MIFCGLGLAAAGLRFLYIGERNGGIGGLAVGLVLIAAGVCLLTRTNSSRKRLVDGGYFVEADFDSAEKAVFNTRANRSIYNIDDYTVQCSYKDPSSGAVRFFKSESVRLHFDPTFELTHRGKLKVYINREDPSEYYVDLEFLKGLDKRRM